MRYASAGATARTLGLHLRTVAQLQAGLQEETFKLIQNPISWRGVQPSEDEQQAFFDEFANRMSRRLLDNGEAANRR